MGAKLLPPPKNNAPAIEWEQWHEALYNRLRGNCTSSGDTAAAIPTTSTYHAVTALSAARALTLPAAKELFDGDEIVIQDESGAAGTHTITISASGADTIVGTNTISSNYGRRRVIKRGAGKFFAA